MHVLATHGWLLALTTTVAGAVAQNPAAVAGVRVEGRVVDALGDPVSLASVVAITRGGSIEVARVQADGDGAFVMPRLPRKGLVLRAIAPCRLGDRHVLWLDDDPFFRVAEVSVVLRMFDAVTVRGSIKDENGRPIPDARVTAEPADERTARDMPHECVASRDDGSFELPVPFGRNMICAFAPNHRIWLETRTLQDDQVLDVVLPGAPSCDLRIHYRGATAEHLDWMAFCEVGDFRPDLWQVWPQSRKDATVTFHGVPIACGLKAFRLFFVPANVQNTSYVLPEVAGLCEIEAPTMPWVRPSQPKAELRGRLVDLDGQPLGGVKLTRWVSPEQTDVAVTGDDGRFKLTVQSELPSVWIGLEDQPFVPVSPRHERHPGDYAFNMFDLPTSGTDELGLVAEKAAAITGRLLDNGKRPVWGALVEIQAGNDDRPSARSVSTLTDREGRFELRGLRASSQFSAWLRATSSTSEFATERLALRVGQTLALGEIVMAKPNTIEGVLPDAGSGPRAGIAVTLIRDSSSRAYQFSRDAFTDRLGRYRFSGIPEGHYTVRVGGFRGRGADWPVLGDATVSQGERVAVGGR